MKTNAIKSTAIISLLILSGCAEKSLHTAEVPSVLYAEQLKRGENSPYGMNNAGYSQQRSFTKGNAGFDSPKAQFRFAAQEQPLNGSALSDAAVESDMHGVEVAEHNGSLKRDYVGPLQYGDPGAAASLWRSSRIENDMFRDERAWQGGDLITILVSEKDQGTRQANTNYKSETTLSILLSHLFGISEWFQKNNDRNVDNTGNFVEGSSKTEFKGKGSTDRQNSLTAKISGLVAEVLPTGILRIEGKKIISVNDEEQIMVISGLVRTKDIDSGNQIDSSKIANMRIDYYGKGSVDEAQTPGWGTRLLRTIWPF